MKKRISATTAARNFSDLLNRIRYQRESFVVERNGTAVCELLPVGVPDFTAGDLVKLLQSLPKVDDGYLDAVERVIRRQQKVANSHWER